MAETYCGKTCGNCEHKEKLNCPGCKTGPGRRFGGDCELARCCTGKGHETCDGCAFKGTCATLRGRAHIPEYRKKRVDAEEARALAAAMRAPVLGKWLMILFWLIIPNMIASVLTNETVAGFAPSLYLPGHLLSTACSVTYGLILLRLSSEEDRYRTAGICSLVSGAVNLLLAFVSIGTDVPIWTLFISIPASIVAFVGEYNEYTAHSTVLVDVDRALSENWHSLWKWYIGLFCVMMGSLLAAFIVPVLGLLLVLAAAIGTCIVRIVKHVYLYRTASVFRQYPVDAEQVRPA